MKSTIAALVAVLSALSFTACDSAQEKARKVGIKLIFPVFFLIFPSVILVTLGPAVLLIFTQMKNLLGQ
jgi:pilus assembly protein TadC